MLFDWTRHLAADASILGGDLRAKGTRVPVSVILDALAEGTSVDEVVRSYPTLTRTHVRAAIAYAAHLAREEELTPLASHARKARREPTRRAR